MTIQTQWNTEFYKPTPPPPPKPKPAEKTAAMRAQVLHLLGQGLQTTAEISKELDISLNAARKHLHRLVLKEQVIGYQKRGATGGLIIYKVKQ